jgi:hypothetical protein
LSAFFNSDCHRIDLEIYIVTGNINGCIYINPYSLVQVAGEDKEFLDLNPLFIILQKNYLEK